MKMKKICENQKQLVWAYGPEEATTKNCGFLHAIISELINADGRTPDKFRFCELSRANEK